MGKRPRQSSASSVWLMAICVPLLLSLIGCAGPRVVTQTETVTVEIERIVPVDPALTYAHEHPDRPLVTWLDALVLAIEYRHRFESCEIRMKEIRGLTDGLD